MIDPTKEVRQSNPADESGISRGQVLQAILFGLIFGFLLQKGGVAKYHVLIGSLLLQDFTVFKVMIAAMLVGMIGLFPLAWMGKVKLHIKPTRYAAVIIGGLVFGAGFALNGYCPGTGAAALGQGNWDSLFMIAGMIAGSWLYAEFSETSKATLEKWGDRGKLLLPDLLGLNRKIAVVVFAGLLVGALLLLDRFTIR